MTKSCSLSKYIHVQRTKQSQIHFNKLCDVIDATIPNTSKVDVTDNERSVIGR